MPSQQDWERAERLMDYWGCGILNSRTGSYQSYASYVSAPADYDELLSQMVKECRTDCDVVSRWFGHLKISLIRKGTPEEGLKLFDPDTIVSEGYEYAVGPVWNRTQRNSLGLYKQPKYTIVRYKDISPTRYVNPKPTRSSAKSSATPTEEVNVGKMIDDFNDLF